MGMKDIDWSKNAPVLYHSSFNNRGFSKRFRDRYRELTGEQHATAWPHDSVRIDNQAALKVVEDIGIEHCGKGLTVAIIERRALPALRILDTDGCEYPHLDPDRFVVHYILQAFRDGQESVDKEQVAQLVSESKMLRVQIVSRGHMSPGASTSNRYSCLSC